MWMALDGFYNVDVGTSANAAVYSEAKIFIWSRTSIYGGGGGGG